MVNFVYSGSTISRFKLLMKLPTSFQRHVIHMASLKTGYGHNQISLQLVKSTSTKHMFCLLSCMVVKMGQLLAGACSFWNACIKY